MTNSAIKVCKMKSKPKVRYQNQKSKIAALKVWSLWHTVTRTLIGCEHEQIEEGSAHKSKLELHLQISQQVGRIRKTVYRSLTKTAIQKYHRTFYSPHKNESCLVCLSEKRKRLLEVKKL